jgi:N-acyl-D-amino-acid deacylase
MTVLFPKRDFSNSSEAEFALREVTSPDGLLITRFAKHPDYEGRTLAEVAKLRGADAPQVMMHLIREAGDDDIGIVATGMDEPDVITLLKLSFANICSDGTANGGHPRGFGAFTRTLGRYVRETHTLSLEEAIRKMTTLSAANVQLKDRGSITAGAFADLVLFDAREIVDRSTTKDPKALSAGVRSVWVNGQLVFEAGKPAGVYPGRVLRRQQ